MSVVSELRYPTRWYAKLIAATLALLFFALLATGTISGFLLYRIVSPARTQGEAITRDFPGHPETMSFTVPGVGSREGWFFPGLTSAPTIILCHGYQSNRGELLTLVTALQDHQYNVFLFDFSGHGSTSGSTTFGFREAHELRAAIEALAQRDDVDRERFGLWGANMGGYVALAVAETDRRVRAVAVDSVYNRPADMVRLQVNRSGLGALPWMTRAAQLGFDLLNYTHRHDPPLSDRLSSLAGVAKLFIQASDELFLAESTRDLFLRSPEPRDQTILPHGNYTGLVDEDKRAYEDRIVSFFLLHLPPTGRLRR